MLDGLSNETVGSIDTNISSPSEPVACTVDLETPCELKLVCEAIPIEEAEGSLFNLAVCGAPRFPRSEFPYSDLAGGLRLESSC